MNVPFTMRTPELEAALFDEAAARGMVQLKGHRQGSVGGFDLQCHARAGQVLIEKLVSLMKSFQAKNSS